MIITDPFLIGKDVNIRIYTDDKHYDMWIKPENFNSAWKEFKIKRIRANEYKMTITDYTEMLIKYA